MREFDTEGRLDARLQSAAPTTAVTDAVTKAGMDRPGDVTRHTARPRPARRLAAVGVAAAVLVGGAGAAAANVQHPRLL